MTSAPPGRDAEGGSPAQGNRLHMTSSLRHPAAIIEREAGETVRRLAREFGLTPSGRADLRHAATSPEPGLGPERLLTPPG